MQVPNGSVSYVLFKQTTNVYSCQPQSRSKITLPISEFRKELPTQREILDLNVQEISYISRAQLNGEEKSVKGIIKLSFLLKWKIHFQVKNVQMHMTNTGTYHAALVFLFGWQPYWLAIDRLVHQSFSKELHPRGSLKMAGETIVLKLRQSIQWH